MSSMQTFRKNGGCHSAIDDHPEDAKALYLFAECIYLLKAMQEHRCIADKYGWETLECYLDEEVVKGEEKENT